MPGLLPGERVFHLALRRDWEAACATGDYRVSTLGRALEDEGFIHLSRQHQVAGVRAAHYTDVTEPLVLLEVDPGRLHAPLLLEVPDGGTEAYPHLYGPIEVAAVVAVHHTDPS